MNGYLAHGNKRVDFSKAQAVAYVSMIRGEGDMAAFQSGVWGWATVSERIAILQQMGDLQRDLTREILEQLKDENEPDNQPED